MSYVANYLIDIYDIANQLKINETTFELMVEHLVQLKARGGRLFIIGVGGSAANASHAVNDFRKICRIDAMTPTDNVAELTARVNDNGWSTVFRDWLLCSRINSNDVLLVLSVGGGSEVTSPCIVRALELAKDFTILGIVGRGGGRTAELATVCAIIPEIDPFTAAPYVESFQLIILHMLVNHPRLRL